MRKNKWSRPICILTNEDLNKLITPQQNTRREVQICDHHIQPASASDQNSSSREHHPGNRAAAEEPSGDQEDHQTPFIQVVMF